MPEERRLRNLVYGQPADKMYTKNEYGDWLQGSIMRGRTRAHYAKELGMNRIRPSILHDVKVSEGRLAKLASSKVRGKVKKYVPLLKVN